MIPLDQGGLPPRPPGDARLRCQEAAGQGVNRVDRGDGSAAVPADPGPVTEVWFGALLAWLRHRAADRPD
jgi:hypothetical protein